MFVVSKEEAAAIRSAYPDYPVTRTCRQHGRKSTYYAAETSGIIRLVEKMRNAHIDTGRDCDEFDGFKVKDRRN